MGWTPNVQIYHRIAKGRQLITDFNVLVSDLLRHTGLKALKFNVDPDRVNQPAAHKVALMSRTLLRPSLSVVKNLKGVDLRGLAF